MVRTGKSPANHIRDTGPPRIESLRVENYRALKNIEFKKITPLMVLLGPNGSGKSTLFDVFNFLSECFQFGLRHSKRSQSMTVGVHAPDNAEIIRRCA